MNNWNEPEVPMHTAGAGDERSWKLLEALATSSLKEQRRARRWGLFFKFLTFLWLFLVINLAYKAFFMNVSGMVVGSSSHTALVDLTGVINAKGDASAENIIKGLRGAFAHSGTKAVILRINSPGGSPVQSGYIYDEIVRLRKINNTTPLYAVITDMGASGGYYIASAADSIFADKASLVGSIGVISSGFGFVEAMNTLGITRRVYSSGEYKAFMDPFQAVDKSASSRWQVSLDTIHKQFIDSVKHGRGDRLNENDEIFSGMVWCGEKAKEIGLVDDLGSASYVARHVVGEEKIIDFSSKVNTIERFARELGAGAVQVMFKIMGGEGVELR